MGTTSGGDLVTVTGTNLDDGSITIGSINPDATSAHSSCTFISPVSSGAQHVQATTVAGTSTATAADLFTYPRRAYRR